MTDADLLTPSLDSAPRTPIFSVNALIAAAFFGGAFAVPLIAMENARRLGRLKRDAVILVFALLATAAATLVLLPQVLLDSPETRGQLRLLNRVVGFAFVGGCYWLHRQPYRSLRMLGIQPASPWVAVIAAVALSIVTVVLLHRMAAAGVLEAFA